MHTKFPDTQLTSPPTFGWPLTDAMIAELAAHVGFEGISAVVANARGGESRAKRELLGLSLKLSTREFMDSWRGTLEIGTVSAAFAAELNIHLPVAPPGRKTNAPLSHIDTAAPSLGSCQFIPNAASVILPPWRELARRGGFRVATLNKTEIEVLDVVDRVLVHGGSWGRWKKSQPLQETINLIPSRLAGHGRRMSTRSYQRAIARLVAKKILVDGGPGPDGTRRYVPFWWPQDSEDKAVAAWRQLAAAVSTDPTVSHARRAAVAPSSHKCRTHVAPPVATRTAGTRYVCRRIGPVGVRHFGGLLTSYFDYRHLNECGTAFHGLDTRDAPCLPNGQARRAVLLSGGAADGSEL